MVLPVRTYHIDWRRRKYIPHKKSDILHNILQSGLATIFYSHGYDPLKYWSSHAGQGSIKRIRTSDMAGMSLELISPSFCTTYISAPEDARMKISCSMPILNLVLEYLNSPFTFEIQLKDSRRMKRRYRISTFKATSKMSTLTCCMPLDLQRGWNKIEINLQELARWSYNSNYVEFLGIQIHANCRLRRVYFSDRKYDESELPDEYLMKNPIEMYKKDDGYASPFTLYPANLYKDWNGLD